MTSRDRRQRISRILAVSRKEWTDTLRDRRSILVLLLTAVAAGPLLLALVLNMIAGQLDRMRDLRLYVDGAERAPALMAFLLRQQVAIVPAPADIERAVRTGEIDVALAIDRDFASDAEAGRGAKVRLYYDRSRDRARSSIAEVESLLRAYDLEWGRGRLTLRGIAPLAAAPLKIEAHDLATPRASGAFVLALVAYYGLFAALIGAMAAALDTTAGERERGSLEPLLCTPARPLELATGKWIALCVLDAIVVVVTLGGFYLTLRFAPLPSVGIPFLFGLPQYATFVAVLAPVILLAPAMLLYVGMRGRSVKEAQANVSVLLFAASALPVMQMFMPQREPWWLSATPVAGQFALLGRVLRGEPVPVAEWMVSCLLPMVLAAAALVLTARLLSRESVLAGK